VRVEALDGVARVTLDRPDRRNALDLAAMELLGERVSELAARVDVRCIVLTGAGGAFCAGADLAEHGAGIEQGQPKAMMVAVARAISAILNAPQPVLAVVDGAAVGVGMSLAIACDMVLASERSYFLLPFTGIGLIPDGGVTASVASSTGRARAMRMALRQERMSAAEAFDAGLIAHLCGNEKLADTAAAWARDLTAAPQQAVARTKVLINRHTLGDLAAVMDREAAEQLVLLASEDYREGVAAFLERRPPRFGRSR